MKGKRWPVLLLAAGGTIAAAVFRHAAPAEREVELRVPRPETVQGIELTWIDADGDALTSSRWSFAHGAPARLTAKLRARDGQYRAQLTVDRADGSATSERRVAFGAEERTVLAVP